MAVIDEVQKALQELGYKIHSLVTMPISLNHWCVELDGKYFGIWDADKKTFVD